MDMRCDLVLETHLKRWSRLRWGTRDLVSVFRLRSAINEGSLDGRFYAVKVVDWRN